MPVTLEGGNVTKKNGFHLVSWANCNTDHHGNENEPARKKLGLCLVLPSSISWELPRPLTGGILLFGGAFLD